MVNRKNRRWIGVTVYGLVLLESLLRLVFPVPEILNFDRGTYSLAVTAGALEPRSSRANARIRWISDPDGVDITHRLSLYGFRDHNWRPKPVNGPRIAIVGDSMVEGFMAGASDTIPAAFEAELDRDRGGEVLNMGVGAAGLREYSMLVRDSVPLFRPDHLILVLYPNDLIAPFELGPGWQEGAVEPEVSRWWIPRFYYLVRGLARGRPIAPRWRGEPASFVAAVPDPRNPWSDGRRASEMEQYVRPDIAEAMRMGRFNAFVANHYARMRETLQKPAELGEYLTSVRDYVAGYSCRLWVVYLPTLLQVWDGYLPHQLEFSEGSGESLLDERYQAQARSLEATTRELSLPLGVRQICEMRWLGAAVTQCVGSGVWSSRTSRIGR